MNENIEKILVKFLMNTANIDDLEMLTEWLKKEENNDLFESYVKINYAMDLNMNEFDSKSAKKEYLRKIREDKRMFYKLKRSKVFKYAAAAILVLGMSYFFQLTILKTSTPLLVNSNIEIGTDKAILTLNDGSELALEKGKSTQTKNANSDGKQIVYKTQEQKSTEIAYNNLTIPRGGQFVITLSDGTKVWLNSESQLKYPVSFIDGKPRRVELVYGEAYFDVSPSTDHKGSSFTVFNTSQEIEVLGTEFNIKAYRDETNMYTTLIEGKVSVKASESSQVLKPNQQATLDLVKNSITISKVNVRDEISWKNGVFSFKRMPLKDIMKVLSRWYDIDVEFVNPELKDVGFNGVLGKDQKIEEILKIIKNYGIIKNYEINNKTILLK
jgi:ferric-dicitrate binding protein FerR (iron transport regulator)